MVHEVLEISLENFARLRASNEAYILLDVREPFEIRLASFPEHVNIPLKLLREEVDQLAKDKKYVTLCHMGVRSLNACLFLREQGFKDVVSLAGGIDAWARQIDFTMPVY
ncbi:MAG: sulfurtransferase [Alphaproteobacteria bacterium]|nr:sulfurtransferase [Alphaproteobacteria bacterium]